MKRQCGQELCPNWTGQGCICEVLDLPESTARRPCTDSLSTQNTFGDDDLFFTGGLISTWRKLVAAVTGPRTRSELQTAVIPVSRIDRPISTGLARSNGVPIDRACRTSQRNRTANNTRDNT